MKKRILSTLTALALCLSLLPTAAFAADETSGASAAAQTAITYIDKNGDAKTLDADDYTLVVSEGEYESDDEDDSYNLWSAGWYVVKNDVLMDDTLYLSGNINLVLCDGATLTVTRGIECEDDEYTEDAVEVNLTVHGQSGGTGSLVVTGKSSSSNDSYAIRLEEGSLTVAGGRLTAIGRRAYSSDSSYGIYLDKGDLSVVGGSLTAIGGETGSDGSSYGIYLDKGDLRVSDGSVFAKGDEARQKSCGIYAANSAESTLSVSGGSVTALSGNASDDDMHPLFVSNLEVSGGTLRLPAGCVIVKAIALENSVTLASLLDAGCHYADSEDNYKAVDAIDGNALPEGGLYVAECEHDADTVYQNGRCVRCGTPQPDFGWYKTAGAGATSYTISTAAELLGFAILVTGDANEYDPAFDEATYSDGIAFAGKTVTLAGDISLAGINWVPIGDDGSFAGIFDGDDHKITDLYINLPDEYELGLFGRIDGRPDDTDEYSLDERATTAAVGVKDLTVSGTVIGNNSIGGIVGQAYACAIENCSFSGTVIGNEYVGGIVGDAEDCTIEDCKNSAAVTGYGSSDDDNVGGIAGDAEDCTIEDCENSGVITAYSDDVGGIVGYADDCMIEGCENSAAVTGYDDYVGGIVGYADDCTIEGCENSGVITADGEDVGGIVGYADDCTIEGCENSAAVTGYDDYVGGIVGDTDDCTIEDCANAGDVTGYDPAGGYGEKVGGIAGSVDECMVMACSNAGAVTGSKRVGGVVGRSSDSAVKDCSNMGDVTGTGNSEGEAKYIGGIVGYAYYYGDEEDPHAIKNCRNTGKVTGGSSECEDDNGRCIGGIAGEIHGYTVENCHNSADVTGYDENLGGIVGYAGIGSGEVASEIVDCSNIGKVTGYDHVDEDDYSYSDSVGGIVGCLSGSTANGCGNTGDVSGRYELGGVVGRTYSSCAVSDCYNTGDVSGRSTLGGVVGTNNIYNHGTAISVTIERCYNAGAVESSGVEDETEDGKAIGGIVGENSIWDTTASTFTVKDCYNTGAVSGWNEIGGVAGDNSVQAELDSAINITNCYNIGAVTLSTSEETDEDDGPTYIGGVTGDNSGTVNVTSCYYLTGCVADQYATADQSISADALAAKATFVGWSFVSDDNGISVIDVADEGDEDSGVWYMDATAKRPLLSGNSESHVYLITYRAGENGSGTIDDGEKTRGEDATLSRSTFTRAGYRQTGWALQDGGLQLYALGGTYSNDAPVELYPVWTKSGDSNNGNTGSSSSGSSGSSSISSTVKNPNGSTTTTTTDKNGTVTETTRNPDGTTGTTVTDKNGNVTNITANVPSSATKKDDVVTIPVEVPAADNSDDAPEIKVTVPSGGATIEIPVEDVTPGTVVVIVGKDGTETVISGTKVTENGVTVTLPESATIKVINNSEKFDDVPAKSYYADAVAWASARGITGGTTDTTFSPYNSCTRAQIVTFLWRAAGCPEPKALSTFSDVSADAYYAKAVAWAVENGITNGFADGTFGVNTPCTRAQAAAFLFRYAAANGMEAVTLQELVGGYGDAAQVPSYALPAFNWALAQGIVNGNNGKLMPNNHCTRAQIVTMLYRLLGE